MPRGGVWEKVTGRPRPAGEAPGANLADTLITAGAVPHAPAKARRDAALGGTAVSRNTPVRAEVQGDHEEAFRAGLAALLARKLAAEGYNIDPAAPVAFRLRVSRPEPVLAGSMERRGAVLVGSGPSSWYAKIDSGLALVGRDGAVVRELSGFTVQVPTGVPFDADKDRVSAAMPAAAEKARAKVPETLEKDFPSLFPEGKVGRILAVDAGGKPVTLPGASGVPVDGFFDAPPTN
jgi:hypothetical protein